MTTADNPEETWMRRGYEAGREAEKTEAQVYYQEVLRLKRGVEFTHGVLKGSACEVCTEASRFLAGLLIGKQEAPHD